MATQQEKALLGHSARKSTVASYRFPRWEGDHRGCNSHHTASLAQSCTGTAGVEHCSERHCLSAVW